MIFRLLRGAFRIDRGRLALVVSSAAIGAGIAAALAGVALQAERRIARELRGFGANIVLEPRAAGPGNAAARSAFLEEAELNRIMTVFWRHNVVGLSPFLTAPANLSSGTSAARALVAGVWFHRSLPRPEGGVLEAGIVPLFPHWRIGGRWPRGPQEAAIGRALAARLGVRPGDSISVESSANRAELTVSGVLSTGGLEEDEILVDLAAAQALLAAPGKISRALVSAVTVPVDAFGRRDPAGMTRLEYERWYCTPYVTSVARQLEEAVPDSRARPVWSLAEAEARVLGRLGVLLAILAGLSLAAAALAVAATFTARVLGRRVEIALWRAEGATAAQVVSLLGAEILVLGVLGGLLGAALALPLVRALGAAVFDAPLVAGPLVAPLAVLFALLVSAAGAVFPVRRALALDPAPELKEAT